MPRDAELDRLKAEQDRAYQRKQATWQEQDRLWQRRQAAREALDRAYHAKQRAYDDQQNAWEDLQRLRDRNGPCIEYLNQQQQTAYENMRSAFDRASSAHDAHDGMSARMYADEGHRYKAESQDAVAERRHLVDEIRDAKARHERTRPAFIAAKSDCDQAKEEHSRAKADHERAQSAFKDAKSDFERAKQAFQGRLARVREDRQQRQSDKRSLAQRAGVPFQYLDNIFISTDGDGMVNIYFGGIGEPSGPGHGHYVMDPYGRVVYSRNPTDPHGSHNFTPQQERPDTVFRERVRPDAKTDYFFNRGAEDREKHGHVVESTDDAGNRTYHYARDREGNIYVDDSSD